MKHIYTLWHTLKVSLKCAFSNIAWHTKSVQVHTHSRENLAAPPVSTRRPNVSILSALSTHTRGSLFRSEYSSLWDAEYRVLWRVNLFR